MSQSQELRWGRYNHEGWAHKFGCDDLWDATLPGGRCFTIQARHRFSGGMTAILLWSPSPEHETIVVGTFISVEAAKNRARRILRERSQ